MCFAYSLEGEFHDPFYLKGNRIARLNHIKSIPLANVIKIKAKHKNFSFYWTFHRQKYHKMFYKEQNN